MVFSAFLLCASPARAGVIVLAACSTCGYQSPSLSIFAGKADFKRSCRFPAACPESGQVVLLDLLHPATVSPPCPPDKLIPYPEQGRTGARVIASWNIPDHDRQVVLTDGDYLCPRCGRQTLHFRSVGHWD